MIFMRSMGADDVLAMMPATPPAVIVLMMVWSVVWCSSGGWVSGAGLTVWGVVEEKSIVSRESRRLMPGMFGGGQVVG